MGPPGPSWAVIAATIVGRTLKVFSCFLRSDFAALGAFLIEVNTSGVCHGYQRTGRAQSRCS
jgi:hypothetical protein